MIQFTQLTFEIDTNINIAYFFTFPSLFLTRVYIYTGLHPRTITLMIDFNVKKI